MCQAQKLQSSQGPGTQGQESVRGGCPGSVLLRQKRSPDAQEAAFRGLRNGMQVRKRGSSDGDKSQELEKSEHWRQKQANQMADTAHLDTCLLPGLGHRLAGVCVTQSLPGLHTVDIMITASFH